MPDVLMTDPDGATSEAPLPPAIQGGRERGLVLHKLLEEVLTGETAGARPALVSRAETLINTLGPTMADDPSEVRAPAELADCVRRSLHLPALADPRPGLTTEFPVLASAVHDSD